MILVLTAIGIMAMFFILVGVLHEAGWRMW